MKTVLLITIFSFYFLPIFGQCATRSLNIKDSILVVDACGTFTPYIGNAKGIFKIEREHGAEIPAQYESKKAKFVFLKHEVRPNEFYLFVGVDEKWILVSIIYGIPPDPKNNQIIYLGNKKYRFEER